MYRCRYTCETGQVPTPAPGFPETMSSDSLEEVTRAHSRGRNNHTNEYTPHRTGENYDFACRGGLDFGWAKTMCCCARSLRASTLSLRGDDEPGGGLPGLGESLSSIWAPKLTIGVGSAPPVSMYWESNAWNDGTESGLFAGHGRPKAGLNIGGKPRPGQKGSAAGSPRPWTANSGGSPVQAWSGGWMKVAASRPKAFSRFLHLARRFWNQT